METKYKHGELIEKKEKLRNVALTLKTKFLGLDNVIDEVISLLMPWYLFPEAQLRPTVINLWGLTGSGKTALVQSIVEQLDYNRLYTHLDMGEFESDSASWIKNIFTEDLEFFHQQPVVIALDEFQFARTLDLHGVELGKDKLRVIWEVLDSGKIDYIPSRSNYYLFRADACVKRMTKAVKAGVTIRNGEVVEGVNEFLQFFEGYYFDDQDRYDEQITSKYFLSTDFIEGMVGLFDQSETLKSDIRTRIMECSIEQLLAFVIEGMHKRPATRQLDLSKGLIFVLGNLDEAYRMSNNLNPDISADDFYEETSRITIATIKRALRKRFRPEQIARLGNNHIIYRSFKREHFMELIERELSRIGDFVFDKFSWKLSFDKSVAEIVYAEGVFPSQGTRPVFTTVKNLIESRISKMVVAVLENDSVIDSIRWEYRDMRFVYQAMDRNGVVVKTVIEETLLKLENLRKSIDPEVQAHTAIHEAGHAVLAALTLRIIPSLVVSRTASDAAEGFCMINFPTGPVTRETLKKDIIITLGGFVAERLIFGEEFTCSGVVSDIEEASALANKAIRKYAMGNDPIYLAVESTQNEDAFFHAERYNKEADQLIKICEEEASSLLERNKLLLLKMGEYLTSNSRMEENLIEEYVRKYSSEEWVCREGFIKKEAYYKFNDVIKRQLLAYEFH